jgi:hypothetical protein
MVHRTKDPDPWGSIKEAAKLQSKLPSRDSLRAGDGITAAVTPIGAAIAKGTFEQPPPPVKHDPNYLNILSSVLDNELKALKAAQDRPDLPESVLSQCQNEILQINLELNRRLYPIGCPDPQKVDPQWEWQQAWMKEANEIANKREQHSPYDPFPYQTYTQHSYDINVKMPHSGCLRPPSPPPYRPSPITPIHLPPQPPIYEAFSEPFVGRAPAPPSAPLYQPGTLPYSALMDNTPSRQETRIPSLPTKAPTYNRDAKSYKDMEDFLRAAERCFDGILLHEDHYLRKLLTLVDDVTATWIDDHLLTPQREPRHSWANSRRLLLAEFKHPLHQQLAITEFGAFHWNQRESIKTNCRRFLKLQHRAGIPDTDARAIEQLHFALPKDLYLYVKLWRDAQSAPISTTLLAHQAAACAIADVVTPLSNLSLTNRPARDNTRDTVRSSNVTCSFCGKHGHHDSQCKLHKKISAVLNQGRKVTWDREQPTPLISTTTPTHQPPTTAPVVPPDAPAYRSSPAPAPTPARPYPPPAVQPRYRPAATAAAVEPPPPEEAEFVEEFFGVSTAESTDEYEDILLEAAATEPIPKNDNRPRCPMTIQDQRVYALCDTGTTVSLISRQFIEEHNIPFTASSQPIRLAIQGVNGTSYGTAEVLCRTTKGTLKTSALVVDLPGHSDFYMSQDLCKRFGIELSGIPIDYPSFAPGPSP